MEKFKATMAVILIASLPVTGLIYFVKASNDCRAKHGELARSATSGLYKCYDKEK